MESILWLVAAVIFVLIEAMTLGLSTIWFAGGAVIAAIAALFNVSIITQIVIFLIVSIVLLIFTRPIALKKLKVGKEKTNVDDIVDQNGVVEDVIRPYEVGQVKVKGLLWSAVSNQEGQLLEKGERVKVIRVEGVKLIVEKVEGE